MGMGLSMINGLLLMAISDSVFKVANKSGAVPFNYRPSLISDAERFILLLVNGL